MGKKSTINLHQDVWEDFDATKLFKPPVVHAEKGAFAIDECNPQHKHLYLENIPVKRSQQNDDKFVNKEIVIVNILHPMDSRDDEVILDAPTIHTPAQQRPKPRKGNQSSEEDEDEDEDEDEGEGQSEERSEEKGEGQSKRLGQLEEEEWEKRADSSVASVQISKTGKAKRRTGKERGHDTTEVNYDFDRLTPEMEVAFRKGRELVRKLSNELDFASKVSGTGNWKSVDVAKRIASLRHDKIPECKFDRPKIADIVMLMDISGSCAAQAEMFMAISAGAIGAGVRIHTGFNGTAKRVGLQLTGKIVNYAKGLEWIRREQKRQADEPDALTFKQFIELTKPKMCIIFGDWDGRQHYASIRRYRNIKFYWFCNYGLEGSAPPDACWTARNYLPAMYTPGDLVRGLKKLRA